MRKKWIAVGLILIFSGLIMIPMGMNTVSISFIPDPENFYTKTNTWNISGYFEKDRRLTLSITPAEKWGLVAGDFMGSLPDEFAKYNETIAGMVRTYHIDYIYLFINITDPKNGTTRFCALYFTVNNPNALFPPINPDPFVVAVSSNDGGLKFPDQLIVDREGNYLYLDDIWGITTYNGTYKISIWEDPELRALGSPLKLELQSARIIEEYPYYSLVPVGGVVVGTGVVSSLLGTKASKKTRKIYRKGYKNKRSKIK